MSLLSLGRANPKGLCRRLFESLEFSRIKDSFPAVLSSTRNPVFAKQKMSPSRSRGPALPCVLFAFLCVFFAEALRADSLEDAARSLARKLVSYLSRDVTSRYSWENHSSASSATSERMRKAFHGELERLRVRVDFESGSNLTIQLRESPSQIYMLAIHSNEKNEVISSVSAPKGQLGAAERTPNVLRLDRQLLWQQPERMLDLAVSNDPSGKPNVMLVMGRETLTLYRWSDGKWVLKDSAALPHSGPPSRDPRGEIHLDDHFFQFHLPGFECDGDAWQKLSLECEEQAGMWRSGFDPTLPFSLDPGHSFFAVDPHYIGPKKFPLQGFFSAAESQSENGSSNYQEVLAGADGHTYVYASGYKEDRVPESVERLPVEWGSDLVSFSAECRDDFVVVATGARDYTSRDTLQGFNVESKAATPVTAVVDFPGPILSLRGEKDSNAVAIVFNLSTGNYEAYHVAMPCDD